MRGTKSECETKHLERKSILSSKSHKQQRKSYSAILGVSGVIFCSVLINGHKSSGIQIDRNKNRFLHEANEQILGYFSFLNPDFITRNRDVHFKWNICTTVLRIRQRFLSRTILQVRDTSRQALKKKS